MKNHDERCSSYPCHGRQPCCSSELGHFERGRDRRWTPGGRWKQLRLQRSSWLWLYLWQLSKNELHDIRIDAFSLARIRISELMPTQSQILDIAQRVTFQRFKMSIWLSNGFTLAHCMVDGYRPIFPSTPVRSNLFNLLVRCNRTKQLARMRLCCLHFASAPHCANGEKCKT